MHHGGHAKCTTTAPADQAYLDCIDKVLVVPSIDLARAGNEGRLGEHRLDLRQQGAIWTRLKAGCDNGGDVVQLGGLTECQDVVLEVGGCVITADVEQASLHSSTDRQERA